MQGKAQTKAHSRKRTNQDTFKEKDKPRQIQGKGQTKAYSSRFEDKPRHIQVHLRTTTGTFKEKGTRVIQKEN